MKVLLSKSTGSGSFETKCFGFRRTSMVDILVGSVLRSLVLSGNPFYGFCFQISCSDSENDSWNDSLFNSRLLELIIFGHLSKLKLWLILEIFSKWKMTNRRRWKRPFLGNRTLEIQHYLRRNMKYSDIMSRNGKLEITECFNLNMLFNHRLACVFLNPACLIMNLRYNYFINNNLFYCKLHKNAFRPFQSAPTIPMKVISNDFTIIIRVWRMRGKQRGKRVVW